MISSSNLPLQALTNNSSVIDTLKKRREELQRLAARCMSEMEKIDTALTAITEKPGRRLNWTKEVLFIFKTCHHPLKTTQILEQIFEVDPQELENPDKRRLYITGLSVALMNLVKKGILKSIKVPGEKGNLYIMAEYSSLAAASNTTKLIAV